MDEDPAIHDSTLREGEQTPRVVFSGKARVKIVELLSEINIDCIEAGFPASSGDWKNEVKRMTRLGFKPTIYGFAKALRTDMDAAIECDCDGVVLSFPSSDIHIKYKLGITREDYLKKPLMLLNTLGRITPAAIYFLSGR